MSKQPRSVSHHSHPGRTKPPAENQVDDMPPTETALDDQAGPDSPMQRPVTPSPLDPAIGRIP